MFKNVFCIHASIHIALAKKHSSVRLPWANQFCWPYTLSKNTLPATGKMLRGTMMPTSATLGTPEIDNMFQLEQWTDWVSYADVAILKAKTYDNSQVYLQKLLNSSLNHITFYHRGSWYKIFPHFLLWLFNLGVKIGDMMFKEEENPTASRVRIIFLPAVGEQRFRDILTNIIYPQVNLAIIG